MPFDSTPTKPLATKVERLRRLLPLLDQVTDSEQASWCFCLGHRAMTDPLLIEAGIPTEREALFDERLGARPHWPDDMRAFASFFGLRLGGLAFQVIFGSHSVELKRLTLLATILERAADDE